MPAVRTTRITKAVVVLGAVGRVRPAQIHIYSRVTAFGPRRGQLRLLAPACRASRLSAHPTARRKPLVAFLWEPAIRAVHSPVNLARATVTNTVSITQATHSHGQNYSPSASQLRVLQSSLQASSTAVRPGRVPCARDAV